MLWLADLQMQNNNEGDSSAPTSDKAKREYVTGKCFDHIKKYRLKEGLDGKVQVKSMIFRQVPLVVNDRESLGASNKCQSLSI